MAEFEFSFYRIREGADGEVAEVPNKELDKLLRDANLALASAPARCQHPADSLGAFELIPDCCVCEECGAVLKNYNASEAQALGIEPGWRKMDAQLLEAEVMLAFKPALDLMSYMQAQTNRFGYSGASWLINWGETVGHFNPLVKRLDGKNER